MDTRSRGARAPGKAARYKGGARSGPTLRREVGGAHLTSGARMAQKGETPQIPARPAPNAAAGVGPGAGGGSGFSRPALPPWSQLWQGPVFLLGLACFAAALVLIVSERKGPDLNKALDNATAYLKAGNYDGARKAMKVIRPGMDKAAAPLQSRYYQLQGDLVFLEQQAHNWDVPDNYKQVVAFYTRAQKLGLAPDNEHRTRWAQALIGLNDFDDALAMIDQLADPGAKVRLIRQVIDRRRASGHLPPALLAELLDRLSKDAGQEKDAAQRRAAMIWTVQARCSAMIDSGDVAQAITRLQQQLVGFMADGRENDLRPLFVLLARAYEK